MDRAAHKQPRSQWHWLVADERYRVRGYHHQVCGLISIQQFDCEFRASRLELDGPVRPKLCDFVVWAGFLPSLLAMMEIWSRVARQQLGKWRVAGETCVRWNVGRRGDTGSRRAGLGGMFRQRAGRRCAAAA